MFHQDGSGELVELTCVEGAGADEYVFSVSELNEADEIVLVLCGDADLDGGIDFADATTVNQYLLGLYTIRWRIAE